MGRLIRPGRPRKPHNDEPTTETYIPTILDRTDCTKHNALLGMPCWYIPKRFGYYAGICNARAVAAGFNHEISASSVVRSKKKSS